MQPDPHRSLLCAVLSADSEVRHWFLLTVLAVGWGHRCGCPCQVLLVGGCLPVIVMRAGSCSYPPLHSASGQSAGLSPVSAAAGNVCPVRRPCQEAGMADWSGSAVQGQTLANAGLARRSEEARQVRWLESLMPRTDRASRVIAAPPERVWAAFVNPGAL